MQGKLMAVILKIVVSSSYSQFLNLKCMTTILKLGIKMNRKQIKVQLVTVAIKVGCKVGSIGVQIIVLMYKM